MADLHVLGHSISTARKLYTVDNDNIDPEDASKMGRQAEWIETSFQGLLQAKPAYRNVRLIDDSGRLLAQAKRQEGRIVSLSANLGPTVGDTSYVTNTMKLPPDGVYVSALRLARDDVGQVELPHRSLLSYAIQIRDLTGQVQGVLIVDVDASPLLAALHERATAAQQSAFLLDQKGGLLVSSEATQAGEDAVGQNTRFRAESPEVSDELLSGTADTTMVGGALIAYTPVHPLAGDLTTYWILVRSLPEDVMLADANEFRNESLILLLISTPIAGLIGLWVAWVMIVKHLMVTIGGLKDLAQGEGDLTKRLPITKNDEVGELVRWFNLFMDKMHDIVRDCSKDTGLFSSCPRLM